MATTRNAPYQAKLRERYRAHRVKRGGKWYNPLLDQPGHPDNTRNLSHGVLDGYLVAGCQCARCSEAAHQENERKWGAARGRRVDEHQGRVAAALRYWLPAVTADQSANGAKLVVSTHGVRNRSKATLTYQQVPVELALTTWSTQDGITIGGDTTVATLASAIIEELES